MFSHHQSIALSGSQSIKKTALLGFLAPLIYKAVLCIRMLSGASLCAGAYGCFGQPTSLTPYASARAERQGVSGLP